MTPTGSAKKSKKVPDGNTTARHTSSPKGGAAKAALSTKPSNGSPGRPAGLRGRAEEMALQADLAAMGVRDELRDQVEAAENAWLAARNRLEAAVGDADAALASLKAALRNVLADVAGAFEAADSAVRRRR